MKCKKRMSVAVTLFAMLAMAIGLPAQDNLTKPKHQQYKLYDVGTFGGPASYGSIQATSLTPAGAVGSGETSIPDPFPVCFNSECLVAHALLWRNGTVTDLGALPGNHGGNSSYGFAINNSGLVAGISENGSVDPGTGYPEVDAVVWYNGQIINLGTFGGTQSQGLMINNRGQVVGTATNAVADPFSLGGWYPATTQTRAFLWEHGAKRDLGTLGGPDAVGFSVNQSGQVIGYSYTSYTPNPDTGVPTIDPFLWDNGKMIDLGSFGGEAGYPQWINNKGQVVGGSYLPGFQALHAFLWYKGALNDLGTLGGSVSNSFWINEAGDAVGGSLLAGDQTLEAFLWSHGRMTSLGHLAQCAGSSGWSINAGGQIVGPNHGCPGISSDRGFLWEKGGPMVDLNALVQPPSDIVVADPLEIDDRGHIVANAVLPSGDIHLVVLVPDGDCDCACEQRIAGSENAPATQPATAATSPARDKAVDWLRNPWGRRLPMPGQRGAPSN